ncbi:hypothetical protein Rin_00021210 [Candidatus Regiella insecticola 5.15]|uniref:Uncharacterized protein n=1 Tax=Candidatus Regiella insecticola 5.15 TaxID=1005043 RepID=G2H224_9ENTR|nr:hypothetical protein Rin_00021210 [Candidatus Regiella insecticola 5.15]
MKLLPLVFVAGLALTSFNLSAKIMANDNETSHQSHDTADRKRCGYFYCT